MLNNKMYLKILSYILGIIFSTTVAYSYYFSKHYPLPITNRISLDAKIQFIREEIDVDKIDTIIVGSSLGLNNVDGAYLEKASVKSKNVLNLSIWSVNAVQVEELLELSEVFPHLERIIYSGQFTSFNHGSKLKNFDADFIKKYISHDLNPLKYSVFILNACKDISFCRNRQKEWKEKYTANNKFGYLDFDHTGSAPLHIYGKDIIQSRWIKVDGDIQNPNALNALSRMADNAYKKNIKFYFIQQPYRQEQIDKHRHIKEIMKNFPQKMKKILNKYHGEFLNLHEKLHFGNEYFADRSHLNDKGSKISAEEIGKFIDESEMK